MAHRAVTYRYVDLTRDRAFAAQLGIFTVPALILYVRGREAIRSCGVFSLEEFLRRTERYASLLLQED